MCVGSAHKLAPGALVAQLTSANDQRVVDINTVCAPGRAMSLSI